MKSAIIGAAFVTAVLCALFWFAFSETGHPATRKTFAQSIRNPKVLSHTLNLMPGQAIDIPNRTYRKIEIRSQFPVRVLTGPCQNNYAVEFYCESDPGDIFITDTRRMPIFLTPQANPVTVTATEF